MKRLLANERTRAGLLTVAAALIGGTGCVTAMVVSSVNQEMARKKWEDKQQLENAAMRAGAERGEVDAMTPLGWYQINGKRFGVPLNPDGIVLLKQAAARQYVPAQYLLGLVLVEGRDSVWRDPARGLELLKLSATKTCAINNWQQGPNYFPARTLALLYHSGTLIPADASEAELWGAREAIYCHRPGAIFPSEGLSEGQRQARLRAWWQLAGVKYPGDNQPASPEQLQETARELERLRQRVRDSEAQYPAPEKNRP